MNEAARYARQISVIGEAGQRRIASLEVEVLGSGLAAEICALYLAGAGVARLFVSEELVERVRAVNSSVDVSPLARPPAAREGGSGHPVLPPHSPRPGDRVLAVTPEDGDPVAAGARAARWALARALGGGA